MDPSVSLPTLEHFLRLLSHDVRNDLNAIDLLGVYLNEITEQEEVRQEVTQLRAAVRFAAQRMIRVSKALQAADAELVDYPLSDLLEDWRTSWESGEGRQGRALWQDSIGIEWERTADRSPVQVDGLLVFEALRELLDNAGAFSVPGSCLQVGAIQAGSGRAGLRIEQTFAESELPTALTDPGVLLQSRRRGHYGLGLFRARRILESFGAELLFRLDPKTRKLSTLLAFAPGGGPG
jgi:signal transduction histidine kinase